MKILNELATVFYTRFPYNTQDQIWAYQVDRIEINGAEAVETETGNVVFIKNKNTFNIFPKAVSKGRDEYEFSKCFIAFRNLLKKYESDYSFEFGIRIIFKDDSCIFRNANSTVIRMEVIDRKTKEIKRLSDRYTEGTVNDLNV